MEEPKVLKSIDDKLTILDKKLSALLAVTIIANLGTHKERQEIKPELILHKAGLTRDDIANILGKKVEAIKKTIQRSKK